MKAMILAAGQGTRMRPLTYELPKPMIPMLGKPVMEYLVQELVKHGFRDIMVNVSHHALKIEKYFGDGRRWGANIGYSFEGHIDRDGQVVAKPLGSAGGLKHIQDFSGFFDDTFLVICGDALIDLDLTRAVRQHWKSGAKASIITKEVAKSQVPNYGIVVADADGKIQSFQEKPSAEEAKSTLANTGIYIFEPEVLELVPGAISYDIGSELFPKILASGMGFNAINLPFSWIDIGRINDYWDATQRLMRGESDDFRMPGREIKPGVWAGINVRVDLQNTDIEGPVYIGASTSIEPNVKIVGPTWIENNCVLESGANITRSIIFEHSKIGGKGEVYEGVVYGRHCVDKEGNKIKDDDEELSWVSDARELPRVIEASG